MNDGPHEIIVLNRPCRAVAVQWDPRGPFVILHEDGTTAEQFREPAGQLLLGAMCIVCERQAS